MKPIGPSTYECVLLNGLPTLVDHNSNDPPNSFHTKDLFEPHSTIPHAWKYLGRLDDRLTLLNGEKVLPTPIEGCVRQEAIVKEAVVCGIGKPIPSVLIFRSELAKDMTDEEYTRAIWPAVKDANARAEAFSQLNKDMIVPIAADTFYPMTDKGSIIRAKIYKEFAEKIDNVYRILEAGEEGTIALDTTSLELYLIERFKTELEVSLLNADTDFFASGIDSLKAIHMRGIIIKDLDLGGHARNVSQNIVFETGNAARLARYLYGLRTEGPAQFIHEHEIEEITAMIRKYSSFKRHTPGSIPFPDKQTVLLTGATGSLGSHILAQLLRNTQAVGRVYFSVQRQKSTPSNYWHADRTRHPASRSLTVNRSGQ